MVAKTATLVDDFSTNDTTKWPNRQGTVTINGTASLACTSTFSVLSTADGAYDLTSSWVYCQIVQVPQAGSQSTFRVANAYTSGFNDMTWYLDNAGLHALVRVAGSANSDLVLTYDPTVHKWWRLRDDGTNLLWDTSADGSAWTNRRSVARPLVLNAVSVELSTGSFDSTARQSLIADNLNTTGMTPRTTGAASTGTGSTAGVSTVTVKAASSGSGSSSAVASTSAAPRVLSAVSTGVGSSAAVASVTVKATSTGSGSTSATAVANGVYIPTIGAVREDQTVTITPVAVGMTVKSLTWTCSKAGFAFSQANGVLTYKAPPTTQGASIAWTLTAVVTSTATTTDSPTSSTNTTVVVVTTHNILRHVGPWMVSASGAFYPLYLRPATGHGSGATAGPFDENDFSSTDFDTGESSTPTAGTVPASVTSTV